MVGAGEEVILMVCSAEKGSEIILITVVVDGMAPPESDNDDCWLSYTYTYKIYEVSKV